MAANLNVDGARLLIGEDSATIGVEEDTTQGKLVTPPGVPGLCVTAKAAAPNDLITEGSLPLSGDNSTSKACDGGVAVATTAPNLDPESNGKSGEKRERESDNTSGIRVKRRLRLSEEQESVQDYDARGAELWIDGEIAACEAYESPQANTTAILQNMLRDVIQLDNGVQRNNNSSAQPVPQLTAGPQTTLTNCFKELLKTFHQNEVLRNGGFVKLINLVRWMQRDSRVLSNEVNSTHRVLSQIRADQRQMLDELFLMLERLNVIQTYVTGLHETVMGEK
ncbi:uncharacterized protein LOC120464553 [Pimephales promelas]|uniref:uncharacterized protein LOC120464553 n=1 Tax=Pimephales promelas TaxID=90988 RepID=UPI00195576B7|nr:uncharacterized protein LOC120464553 [Pimephales promelas]KAG1935534.1 hypothetical protein F2P79_019353 [Pimephales promelas]